MANLYLIPAPFFAISLFLAVLLFIANVILFYYSWPERHFHAAERLVTEGCSLLLLFMYISLLFEVWDDQTFGLVYFHFMEDVRFAVGAFCIGTGLYGWCRGDKSNAAIIAAGIFFLPWCDSFLPWSLLLAYFLLGIRIFFYLPPAYAAAQKRISERSIQDAVDALAEGVLISKNRGEPVLVNALMRQVMVQILGVYVRNGNLFWHLLRHLPVRPGIGREEQGRALLFHLPNGQSWLLRRDYFQMPGRTGWQITAAEVSQIVKINQQIEEKNALLEKRNADLRHLLHNLGEIQGRETTAALKSRIHDLMGQRITMLQQLLNNNEISYEKIAPLVKNIFADIREDLEVEPALRLNELVQDYQRLGVSIKLSGSLPEEKKIAREWLRIIREGITNALSHGQATAVHIYFRENGRVLIFRDNGIGCKGPLKEGTGLSGMRRRVAQLGGRLQFTLQPHFVIRARIGGKKHDTLDDRRRSENSAAGAG